MSVPTIIVTPGDAARAYGRVERGDTGDAPPAGATDGTGSFGAALGRALGSVVQTGHDAEAAAMAAIAGGGDVTGVVTAVAKADLALQTTVAIRDRVVQAYQDIMRMPI